MNARLVQGLAVGLSMLAGFVDAMGYLALGSLFVAFMSGNSTILGVAVVDGLGERSRLAAALVGLFVGGVMVGTWVGRPFGVRRSPVLLVLVAAMLATAAGLAQMGSTVASCMVVALAMGTENTVFQKDGGAGVGLTYMTGTLVRLGQSLAHALVGGPWAAALPDLLLWSGMVAGAGLGAAVYQRVQLDGLWVAVVVSLGMAGIAWRGQRVSAVP